MKNCLFLFALLFSSSLFAQKSVDLFNVFYRTSPNAGVLGSEDERQLTSFVVNGKAPLVIDSNNIIIVGLEYQNSRISQNKSNAFFHDIQFNSTMLQLGYDHKFNPKTKALFMGMFRINSDFVDVNRDHLQTAGLVLVTSKKTEQFAWQFGAYANTEFFGLMVVPLIGFNWEINPKWRLKMLAPVNMELGYMPNAKSRMGFRYEGNNSTFFQRSAASNFPSLNDQYLDKADNNVWLFYERQIVKNIWLHAKAGYSVLREYRNFNTDDKIDFRISPVSLGDNRNSHAMYMANSTSFEIRMIYRLPI
ncbi:MAG: hypothetical protein ACJAY8_001472 [Sphingobacteriales bacterium]|jgi:hypothetical protein